MTNISFKKAIFLDRDGVLNHDPGDYTMHISDFKILPNTIENLKKIHDLGYGLIVITNQAGIAKGLYPKTEVEAMHQYLQGLCLLQGFMISHFYYCPHHPDFSGKCLCRKPKNLLVTKGLHRFQLKAKNCFFIGDKERDIIAGETAGVKGILVKTNAPNWDEIIKTIA